MNASDLTVQGIESPYASKAETIRCFLMTGKNEAYLPPRFNVKEKEYHHVEFPVPAMKLRPEQSLVMDEIDTLMESQDGPCKYAFLHIYTGFGKTVIGSHLALTKGLPTLIIVNTDAIRKGWINTFQDQGLELGKDIHVASGSQLGRHNVCILSIQLATRHKFSRKDYAHYGTVIIDEADVMCTQLAVHEMVKMYPRYMVGMSATVTRQDGLHKVLDIFWGPRSRWIIRQKSFSKTSSMEIRILHTGFQVESHRNRRGALDWTAISTDVMNIWERNLMIRNLCLIHRNKKILILCKRKDHVDILVDLLQQVGEDVSSYHGASRSYYDANVLVATISKAGRGYDDKQVSSAYDGRRFDMIILVMTMKDADQAIGRGLRGSSLLLYVLVDDNPTMRNHADSMRRINAKRGATISEHHM